jgi:hypothetical protein
MLAHGANPHFYPHLGTVPKNGPVGTATGRIAPPYRPGSCLTLALLPAHRKDVGKSEGANRGTRPPHKGTGQE